MACECLILSVTLFGYEMSYSTNLREALMINSGRSDMFFGNARFLPSQRRIPDIMATVNFKQNALSERRAVSKLIKIKPALQKYDLDY